MFAAIKEILQVIVDFIFYIIPRSTPEKEKIQAIKLVAHRGWHNNEDILENTLKSFELACKHGLYAIEFDIRWTKDLVPVVHHDPDLSRLWNINAQIKDLSFADLRKFVPQIPTLKEVVNMYGQKIHFFVELKEEYFPSPVEQKKILSETLGPLRPLKDFHFLSLSMAPINIFDQYDKKAYFLVANFNIFDMSTQALMHDLGGVTGHYVLCSNDILRKHHTAGQKVGTGFIRTPNCLKREVEREADYIFTNHPWNLVDFIESAG